MVVKGFISKWASRENLNNFKPIFSGYYLTFGQFYPSYIFLTFYEPDGVVAMEEVLK